METPTLRIFSPSQTNNYSFCPRYWALKRQDWVPRIIDYPELCAVLGHGFAAFAETYNKALLNRMSIDAARFVEQATDEMTLELTRRKMDGQRRIIGEKDLDFCDKLPTLLRKAATLYHANDPLASYKIIQVETQLSEEDKGRPDVVCQDSQGIFPVDYKVKMKLEEQWRSKELRKYDRSWQMRHYCAGLNTLRYGICMIVLAPKAYVHYEPYTITDPIMQSHKRNAVQLWANMTDSSDDPRHQLTNTKHADEYGECEMVGACESHMLDEQAMLLEYVQLPRRQH